MDGNDLSRCLQCPTDFVATKPWQKFCSDLCRMRYNTARTSQARKLMAGQPLFSSTSFST